MSREHDWVPIRQSLPPDGEVVDTKIDSNGSVRNKGPLKRQGNLWFFPDSSMYVYYTPTHWRRIDGDEGSRAEEGREV